MYVAVKGGENAIAQAHAAQAKRRRGSREVASLSVRQIQEQLSLAVDRVMSEGALYDPELAALAIKQAQGDLIEAVFLLRAYRTTQPRLAGAEPVDTLSMVLERRISAIYKDAPGGQVLGATHDYAHRLLDFSLLEDGDDPHPDEPTETGQGEAEPLTAGSALTGLRNEGLAKQADPDTGAPPADITREPLRFPASRDARLQRLARADEGFLLGLGYSTQRGFGNTHPFVGELRCGEVAVDIVPEELGFAVTIGRITLTECTMVNQFEGGASQPPRFTAGYGLAFGRADRKAMTMALTDRALQAEELGEVEPGAPRAPAQDHEFVLLHCDNVQATGFVEHLKLPHYVDFQSELETVRRLKADWSAARKEAAP